MPLLMYAELASWWSLLSPPADYAEDAAAYRHVLESHARRPIRALLELGSGGGNNASHLKDHWSLTLVDRSDAMLAVSRALNPECEHLRGDMRSLRIGRSFDAVFVHDAASYLQTLDEVRAVAATAFVHLAPGGAVLFVPDWTRESFRPTTAHGGGDSAGRRLRWLSWTVEPGVEATRYETRFSYLLESEGRWRCEYESHTFGLFDRDSWLAALEGAGFEATLALHDEGNEGGELFVGVRPADAVAGTSPESP